MLPTPPGDANVVTAKTSEPPGTVNVAEHVKPFTPCTQFGDPGVVANVTAGPAVDTPPLLCNAIVILFVFGDR